MANNEQAVPQSSVSTEEINTQNDIAKTDQTPPVKTEAEQTSNEKTEASDHTDQGTQDKDNESDTKLSKRQLKKQLKTQRWLDHKYEKRQHERVKKKARRHEARERGEDLGPSRKRLKQNRMRDSACKVRVLIDCSFDDLMRDREISSLVAQISFSYAANRRAENPLQYYVTSVDNKTEKRLQQQPDHKSWDINFKKEHFDEVFKKDEIVYLSSDSENVLETLEDDKVYVIGGLVDHNAHKGHCHALAVERGYKHAQLPIGKYLELKSRKVLAVNHVFEILLHYTETQDWEKAFYRAIPKRKVNLDDVECSKHCKDRADGDESNTLPKDTEQSESKASDNKDASATCDVNLVEKHDIESEPNTVTLISNKCDRANSLERLNNVTAKS